MEELKLIYKKRKHQLLPLFFFLGSFFVIFRIILPQLTDISDAQSLIDQKKSAIEAKSESLRVLNSMSDSDVDANYDLVSTALPLQKDVVLIFTELSDASSKAGVSLGGFNVKVGGIYEAKGKSDKAQSNVSGLPFLNIIINVTGPSQNLKDFSEILNQSLPLVGINSVNIGKNDARFDVNFYYKPVVTKPLKSDTTALSELTSIEKKELEKLQAWKNGSSGL